MACQRTAPGLVTDQLMREFGMAASAMGLAASVQFFVYTVLQIPMGMLMDRYGPRLFLIHGAVLTGGGTILYSLAVQEWMLYVSRMLAGIGDATIWVGLVIVFSQLLPPGEFSRLIGVASMTGILGFQLATAPLSAWVDLLGWRGAFLSLGVLLAGCGVLLAAVLPRTGAILAQEKASNRSLRGIRGIRVLRGIRRISLIRVIHAIRGNFALRVIYDICGIRLIRLIHGIRGILGTRSWRRGLWMNRQSWALFCCHFGIVGGYIGFIGSWAVPYGMEVYGMSRLESSQLMMASLAGALAGAPLIGWIAGRLRSQKQLYVFFHVIMFLCWSALSLLNGRLSGGAVLLVLLVMGACFGANSITFTLVRHAFPLSEAGMVTGFANTGGFLSAMLLPGMTGAVLDAHMHVAGGMADGFAFGFLVPALFSVIGIAGVLAFREDAHR